MALIVDPFQTHVGARLLDFFNPRTAWHRWLWSTGLVLTLREVLESSEAVHAAVLSEATLRNLAGTANVLAGRDPGTGAPPQKTILQQSLKSELKFQGLDYLTIEQIAGDIDEHYLDRWATALNTPAACPGAERTARAIASHLLDAGLSLEFLHRWWAYKIHYEPGTKSLGSLVAEAHVLVRQPLREYEVLVAFDAAPASSSGMPANWVDAPKVSQWLRDNGFSSKDVRQNGGLWIKVKARDSWSAVEASVEVVDRIAARIAAGTHGRLTPTQSAWIAGEKQPFPLRRRPRGVEVRALHREDKLYYEGEPFIVDAAIELLAPLSSSSPGPAVAGGWAAIEALLSGPEGKERVLAGDRMACLVACSFPRAELTVLSYQLEKAGDPIAARLKLCSTNRERATLVADEILRGTTFTLPRASDVAALNRMKALLANPQQVLQDIQNHVATSFRRLYRHRNMVLHWGRTNALALRASLRTSAPLVGAGMDRIAHAWYADEVPPLELAAKANIRLSMASFSGVHSAVVLLD